MNRTLLLLVSILVAIFALGQPPVRQATEQEQELMDRSHDCAKVKQIPASKRLLQYPFNEAAGIQLVSFKSSYDSVWGEYYRDSLPHKKMTQ